MIVDLHGFVEKERPVIAELGAMLDRIEQDPSLELTVAEAERLHYLYHRAASALSKLESLPATQEIRAQLSAVVARAFAELHDTRSVRERLNFRHWLLYSFPETVRRHAGALGLSVAVTVAGAMFGAYALSLDLPNTKEVLLPFAHLQDGAAERVVREHRGASPALEAHQAQFAAQLMVNNVRVSITALAFGILFGVGTILLLFYNGVILGAVIFDYLRAGHGVFVTAWLLPHGSIEIPAILIAGQAGLVLGKAVLGWGDGTALPERLRRTSADVVTLIAGVALLLVWAGLVESFFSQYHEPTVPYAAKIVLGVGELALLVLWLSCRRPLNNGRGNARARSAGEG